MKLNVLRSTILPCIVFLNLAPLAYAQPANPERVEEAELGETPNVHVCGSVYFAGQPGKSDIEAIKEKGIKRVVTLRTDGEIDWDEATAVKDAGLDFAQIPFRGPETLNDDVFAKIRALLNDDTPTLLHCASANRVGAVWLVHRVLDAGVPLDKATEEARLIGLRTDAYLEKATEYLERNADQRNVLPGINAKFVNPELNVEEWLGRFEVESREVYSGRDKIVAAIGLRKGDRVADIGAGTGFFSRLFAHSVGEEGWVFAVDISPKFIEHIASSAEAHGVTNLSAVLSNSKTVSLPPDSVDVVFICDTYHHFEYPAATLRSIHRALKPKGRLIVIDFERIPGTSREFIIGHVRAGKKVFRKEIEEAGFELEKEVELDVLKENYFLEFQSTKTP